jgi:RNA polymerase sigma factor (sigma-70 family)
MSDNERVSGNNEYDEEITALFRKYHGRLRGFLINIGAAPDIADDVVVFAFTQLPPHWARLRVGRPDIYLHRVALNEYTRRQREARREEPCSDPPETPVVDPCTGLIDRLALRWALGQLPGREREAVTLRHCGGLNVAETAAVMGEISEGSVKRYTFDGLRKLRKLLQDHAGAGESENR